MIVFLSSSPCVVGAPKAILNPENGFVEHLKNALPRRPRVLFVCSERDGYGFTDGFARDFSQAIREAGIDLAGSLVLDGRTAHLAEALMYRITDIEGEKTYDQGYHR